MNVVQKLRKITGLSQGKFAKLFGIPTRTLQRWEIEQAFPPKYFIDMMLRILIAEDNSFDKESIINLKLWYSTQENPKEKIK